MISAISSNNNGEEFTIADGTIIGGTVEGGTVIVNGNSIALSFEDEKTVKNVMEMIITDDEYEQKILGLLKQLARPLLCVQICRTPFYGFEEIFKGDAIINELKKIQGGGMGIGLLVAAGIIFVIGIIDGYVRPLKCN